MNFPLGKPILVLFIAAALSGAALYSRPVQRPSSDLILWTFTSPGSLPDTFYAFSGHSVSVKLMSTRALDTRLLSLFMGTSKPDLSPDAVEVEVGSIGKFFRPPASNVGFLPLDEFVSRDGLASRFLPARLGMWKRSGQLFGLPLDVHPVSLTYRKDLFDAARVDPSAAHTWTDLQGKCRAFETYWHTHECPNRHAIELNSAAADYLVVMLQQRHISLLTSDNRVCFSDQRVAATVAFYAQLVAGPSAVAGESSPGDAMWAGDLSRGDLCMLFTPDWRTAQIPRLAPELAQKLAMMPLPVFDDDDAPTGSWGGTMIGIPRNCRDPARAWGLVKYAATHPPHDPTALIPPLIPPLPESWSDPIYHQPDPFYAGGQSVDDLYIRLARQLPERVVTSFSTIADVELSHVLSQAVSQLRSGDDRNLEQNCRSWLAEAADDLNRRIAFATFDR